MGVDISAAQFLRSERDRGVSFARTLTLGRQHLYMSPGELRRTNAEYIQKGSDDKCRDLFASLGARVIDAIDASGYEGANIIHDMNIPLDVPQSQRWSCVFDGGSLEHIFNFPQAIKNCLEVTEVGGHFISITPWSGWAGHGFYQFCPELFYRILSHENGFQIERMLFQKGNCWYHIRDPKLLGHRFELQSSERRQLYISARRTDERPIFAVTPQQSDYAAAWAKSHCGPEASNHQRWTAALAFLFPRLFSYARRRRAEGRVMRTAVEEVFLDMNS
ncbi:MAG: hypothetical protein RIQ71_291 [Verrucomicrobiota bacterium]|jgi:hypothetical protein